MSAVTGPGHTDRVASSWSVEIPPGVEIVAHFRVPGEPVSKARPRLGENGNTYTPKRTRDAEDRIGWQFKRATQGKHRHSTRDSFGIAALFVYKRATNRDTDNLLKLVKDALNGIAYTDDGQVTQCVPTKVWDPDGSPYTEIVLYRTRHPRPVAKPRGTKRKAA